MFWIRQPLVLILGLMWFGTAIADVTEDNFWRALRNDPDEYRIYVTKYPSGKYVAEAERRASYGLAAPSKEQLQSMYMDYLRAEGFQPSIDSDGDIQFKKEGRTLFIDMRNRDDKFVRIVFAGFWKIENETERAKVLAAISHSNAKIKVSKLFIANDRVWAAAELLLPHPGDLKAVLPRALSTIDGGVRQFVEKMRE